MRKINATIAITLAVLAIPPWAYVCFRSVTTWTSADQSIFVYPALFATVLTVCACLGWILVTRSVERGEGETRCRKCKYILRGLTEPRCPECGTPI